MSLIQEALKRQQEELNAEKRGETPRVPTPPQQENSEAEIDAAEEAVVQPTEPEAPPTEEKPKMTLASRKKVEEAASDDAQDTEEENPVRRTSEKDTKVVGPLLTAVIILILLLGIVAWAIVYGYRMFTAEKPADDPIEVANVQPQPEDAAPAVPPTSDEPEDQGEDSTATTKPRPAEVTPTPPEDVPENGDTVAGGNDTSTLPPAEDQPAVATVADNNANTTVAPPVTPPGPQSTTPEQTAPPPPVEPIIWPQVVVSGVIGAGDSGSAIINGEVIGKNETVDEVTVREFGKGFVLLEYQGETRKFSVGRPLR
jgi:hypothetical protein